MENEYQIKVDLCNGDKCIHRFRCYRHSLFQDAKFKNNNFHSVDTKDCINPADENKPGFHRMWLPNNIPSK